MRCNDAAVFAIAEGSIVMYVARAQCTCVGEMYILTNVHPYKCTLPSKMMQVAASNVCRLDTFYLKCRCTCVTKQPGDVSLGVLMVEVRGDGQRPLILRKAVSHGMTYVGQVHGVCTT